MINGAEWSKKVSEAWETPRGAFSATWPTTSRTAARATLRTTGTWTSGCRGSTDMIGEGRIRGLWWRADKRTQCIHYSDSRIIWQCWEAGKKAYSTEILMYIVKVNWDVCQIIRETLLVQCLSDREIIIYGSDWGSRKAILSEMHCITTGANESLEYCTHLSSN